MQFRTEDISVYMKDISSIDTISREEETRLANEMKSNDPDVSGPAREKLICANLRLVVKIAHEFKGRGVGFADLVEEGNTGLITAVNKYDPDKGVKFSCYAAWWIKEAMYRALHTQARLIRMPSGTTQKMMKVVKARRRYMQEYDEDPSIEELAALTGFSTTVVSRLIERDVTVVSMDESIADTTDTTFESVLADRPDDSSRKKQIRDEVDKAVSNLCDMDRLIITSLFGLGDSTEEMRSIAQETGMPVMMLKEHLTGILASLKTMLAEPLTAALPLA